ncbi:hypothetical protein TanjilG_23979 [Lupinus angustifolius]|uniref:Pectinesterase inhibitor domain-containing protein n=1 Tax=Lupinus angustifolius TaxID=3871 RepID=A0A1J7GE38_LUPAN|nr:hypothetical protein TanjilG_23979 [Lupinus angustifolius]
MSCSKVPYLLFPLSIILICYAPIASSSKDLANSVCNNANNEDGFGNGNGITLDDCFQLMTMDPKFYSASNYRDLSKFLIQFAIQKGTENKNKFIQLQKDFPKSKAIVQCGTTFYTAVISVFEAALKEWDTNTQNALHEISQSADGTEQCIVAIDGEKLVNGNITNMNKMMFLLTEATFSALDLSTQ